MTPGGRDKLESGLLCACAAILAAQLFLPPSIGLADTGDFSQIYGRFSLAPVHSGADNYAYFAPIYWFSPENYWRTDVLSSETLMAAPPILLTRATGSTLFDLRSLGVLHALVFLVAFYALLVYLRRVEGWRQLALAAAALWIFGDVAYVAYCNSFYSDTAAILGMLLMVPLALLAVAGKAGREGALLSFTAASVLFVGSKPQHAVAGVIAAAVVLVVMRRALVAALLLCAVWATLAGTPPSYRARPLFNLVFYKIAGQSPTPRQDLRELGLDASDLPYAGMRANTPGSPASDPQWMSAFVQRTGFFKVVWFYLRHPVRMFQILAIDLRRDAFQIRPQTLGNFRREEGLPPGTRTRHFESWSHLRSALFSRWPWHVAVWYVLFLGVSLRLARRSPAAGIAAGVAAMGIVEFFLPSLSDAAETSRHFVLFHLLTDITIFFALGWLFSSGLARATRRDTAAAPNGPLPAKS